MMSGRDGWGGSASHVAQKCIEYSHLHVVRVQKQDSIGICRLLSDSRLRKRRDTGVLKKANVKEELFGT